MDLAGLINGPIKREFIGLISFVTGSANFDSAVKILMTVYECDSLILNLIDNIIVDLYNWLNS